MSKSNSAELLGASIKHKERFLEQVELKKMGEQKRFKQRSQQNL